MNKREKQYKEEMDKLLDLWKQRVEVFGGIKTSESEIACLAVGIECMKDRLREVDNEIEALRVKEGLTRLDMVLRGMHL